MKWEFAVLELGTRNGTKSCTIHDIQSDLKYYIWRGRHFIQISWTTERDQSQKHFQVHQKLHPFVRLTKILHDPASYSQRYVIPELEIETYWNLPKHQISQHHHNTPFFPATFPPGKLFHSLISLEKVLFWSPLGGLLPVAPLWPQLLWRLGPPWLQQPLLQQPPLQQPLLPQPSAGHVLPWPRQCGAEPGSTEIWHHHSLPMSILGSKHLRKPFGGQQCVWHSTQMCSIMQVYISDIIRHYPTYSILLSWKRSIINTYHNHTAKKIKNNGTLLSSGLTLPNPTKAAKWQTCKWSASDVLATKRSCAKMVCRAACQVKDT